MFFPNPGNKRTAKEGDISPHSEDKIVRGLKGSLQEAELLK